MRLFKRGSKSVWKRGSVVAFPRLSRGPYDLVFRALANIVAGRNKVVNYPKAWELEEESMANVEAMEAMTETAKERALTEEVADLRRKLASYETRPECTSPMCCNYIPRIG